MPRRTAARLAACGVALALLASAGFFTDTLLRRPAPAPAPSVAVRPSVTLAYEPGPGDSRAGRFTVRNLPPEWLAALADDAARAKAFEVRVAAGPVLGESGAADGVAWFRPRFPLAPGVEYAATYARPDGGTERMTVEIGVPTDPPPTLDIHPAAAVVPENLLKFYLQFTAPVRRGEAARRVQLVDEAGAAVDLPFLELDEELWDPAGTRLTLFIDPGRIKRGLKPREDAGPALVEGKTYTLTVDPGWLDANGKPLGRAFAKAFRVGPPAAARLDPAAWQLNAPAPGTHAPLTARFPAPLDHALLERGLTVTDAAGVRVRGAVKLLDADAGWELTPTDPWAPGAYTLTADPDLEDLAGNRVDRVFDAEGPPPAAPAPRTRAFRVGK